MAFDPFAFDDPGVLDVTSKAAGPAGSLPFTAEMLRTRPSGDLFGWSQNAGMGWNPAALGAREFLILSTHGGVRAPDGTPVALGYHTGHWEVGLLVEEAAKAMKGAGATPFAAAQRGRVPPHAGVLAPAEEITGRTRQQHLRGERQRA